MAVYLYVKINHKYWSKQPVQHFLRFNLNDDIITGKMPEKFDHPNYKVEAMKIEKNNLKQIKDLLNNCYNISDDYKFTFSNEYLAWSLNFPHEEYRLDNRINLNLGIRDGENLIAYLHSKVLTIMYDQRKMKMFYVDYLCIDKKYRKMSLAQSIISYIVDNGNYGIKTFLFQKEYFPLPFRYILKYSEYLIYSESRKDDSVNAICESSNSGINKSERSEMDVKENYIQIDVNELTDDKKKKYYDFYLKFLDDFDFYTLLSYNEFLYYLDNKDFCFYTNLGNNIELFGCMMKNNFAFTDNENSDLRKIVFLIGKKSNYQRSFLKYILNQNINIITNDFMVSKKEKKKKKFKEISIQYVHFYNFGFMFGKDLEKSFLII